MTNDTLLGIPAVMSQREVAKQLGISRREVATREESALDKLYFILALRWGLIPLDWEPEGQ